MKKLSNITESVWGDIRKRSTGETTRKEENVNLLDRDGFYEYIMKHYKTIRENNTIINSKDNNDISIPILKDNYTIYRLIIFNFDENESVKSEKFLAIPIREPFWGSKLFVKIRDSFKLIKHKLIKNSKYVSNPVVFEIWPKEPIKEYELNKFFLEVIDFIIDNAEESFEPLLKRI